MISNRFIIVHFAMDLSRTIKTDQGQISMLYKILFFIGHREDHWLLTIVRALVQLFLQKSLFDEAI